MSARTRVMLGVMLASGLLGLIDWLGGDGAPQPAQAGAGAPAAPAATALPARPPIDGLLARLRGGPLPPPPAAPARNVFALSDAMRVALSALKSPSAPASDAAPGAPGAPGVPADATPEPVLRAILAGAKPLALIDDRLLAVGAALGEQRIIRIERDRVVLSDGEHEQILRLRPDWSRP